MYKVIKFFTDLHDAEHPYNVGDEFPRKGVRVSAARIAELADSGNKQGQPLIELVVEESVQEAEPAVEEKPKKAPAKKAKKVVEE